jgi:hypothetical protein
MVSPLNAAAASISQYLLVNNDESISINKSVSIDKSVSTDESLTNDEKLKNFESDAAIGIGAARATGSR